MFVHKKNINKKIINCLACGSKNYISYLKPSVSNYKGPLFGYNEVRGTQNLVRCMNCSLIFENPIFDQKHIIGQYKAENFNISNYNFNLKLKTFTKSFLNFYKFRPIAKNRLALDIGCGGGGALVALKKFGFNSEGIEPSKQLSLYARKLGFKIYNNSIENFSIKKKYDLIILYDVLEHLRHPNKILNKIYKILKPNGKFIINIPDEGSFLIKLLGKYNWWIMSCHLAHYNKKSLQIILKKNNFKIIKKNKFYQYYTLGYLLKIASNIGFLPSKMLNFVPNFLKNFVIKYYAGQTTFLVKKII
jgi:2-polyprenyl-3-methyl-5-hydroxy-6-metoxy-1,4-benzoquinol methylase